MSSQRRIEHGSLWLLLLGLCMNTAGHLLGLQNTGRVTTNRNAVRVNEKTLLKEKSRVSHKSNRWFFTGRIGTATDGCLGVNSLFFALESEHGRLLLEPHGLDQKPPKHGMNLSSNNAPFRNSEGRHVGKCVRLIQLFDQVRFECDGHMSFRQLSANFKLLAKCRIDKKENIGIGSWLSGHWAHHQPRGCCCRRIWFLLQCSIGCHVVLSVCL